MVAGGDFPSDDSGSIGGPDTRGVNELADFAEGAFNTSDGMYRTKDGYLAADYNGDGVWDKAWMAEGSNWKTTTDGHTWTSSPNPASEYLAWEFSQNR